ncbi:hypothetical protein VPHK120G1_0022 [Vibrio phage K120 g1]
MCLCTYVSIIGTQSGRGATLVFLPIKILGSSESFWSQTKLSSLLL